MTTIVKAVSLLLKLMEMRICILLSVLTILFSCKKSDEQCKPLTSLKEFVRVSEFILDTFMVADTVYSGRPVKFISGPNVENPNWKIGDDPRNFTTQSVDLVFSQPATIGYRFSGLPSAPYCKTESINYLGNLTIVKDDGKNSSSIQGKFRVVGKTSIDTFTIEIKKWIGQRYPWWPTGAYSIENFPKGYSDTTKNFNGIGRPEITGIVLNSGYKNFAFDKSGNVLVNGIKAYGHLISYDTLRIDYIEFNKEAKAKPGSLFAIRF